MMNDNNNDNTTNKSQAWKLTFQLTFGNYQTWVRHVHRELSLHEKPDYINFLKTEQKWVPKRRVLSLSDENGHDEEGTIGKKLKEEIATRMHIKRLEEIEKVRGSLYPRIAALMLAYVSKPVKQALEMHPRYDVWSGVVQNSVKEEEVTVDAEYGPFEDPLELLKMLIDVTRRQRFRHNVVFQANDVVRMRKEWVSFSMVANENMHDYLTRFQDLKKDLQICGVEEMQDVMGITREQQEVMMLFRGLSPKHPARAYLQTLFKASATNPTSFPSSIVDFTKTVQDFTLAREFDEEVQGQKKAEPEPQRPKQPKHHAYNPGSGSSSINYFTVAVSSIQHTDALEVANDEYDDMPSLMSDSGSESEDIEPDSDNESEDIEPAERLTSSNIKRTYSQSVEDEMREIFGVSSDEEQSTTYPRSPTISPASVPPETDPDDDIKSPLCSPTASPIAILECGLHAELPGMFRLTELESAHHRSYTRMFDGWRENDDPPDRLTTSGDNSSDGSGKVVNVVNSLTKYTCYTFDTPPKCRNKPDPFGFQKVLLDSQAGCSIFRDAEILSDLRENETLISVSGIGEGAQLIARHAGTFMKFGLVAYCPTATANILSLAEMVDRKCRVSYYSKDDLFVLTSPCRSVQLRFQRVGRHYVSQVGPTAQAHVTPGYEQRLKKPSQQGDDTTTSTTQDTLGTQKGSKRTVRFSGLKHPKDIPPASTHAAKDGPPASPHDAACLSYALTDNNVQGTISERAAIYSKRDVNQAIQARQLQARLGFPPSSDLAKMTIHGSTMTARDLAIADHIYGPPTPSLKGRTTKKSSPPIVTPSNMRIEEHQVLEVDLMFVRGLPFFVAILVPLGYSFVTYVPTKSEKEIRAALLKIIDQSRARHITITDVVSDNEPGVKACEAKVNQQGIRLSFTAAGEKVHRIERRIRFIKERTRAIMHSLAYSLCAKLLSYCVQHANWCTNIHRLSTSTHARNPHEQFSGRPLHAPRDIRHAFGDYAQATIPHPNNTMQSRTEPCIALTHSGSLTGGVLMYAIKSGATMVRDQFRILPIPPALVTLLNKLATKDNLPPLDDPHDEATGLDNPTPNPTPDVDTIHVDADQLAPAIEPEWRGVTSPAATAHSRNATRSTTALRNEQEALADTLSKETIAKNTIQIPQHKDSSDDEEGNKSTRLIHTENSLDDEYWHAEETVDIFYATILNISVNSAMKSYGQTARESILKEIKGLWQKKAWTPTRFNEISTDERKRVIRSFMFLKEKFTAEGLFDKLKSRLVAGGHMQDRELYDDLASPTAALMSLFILCAIVAHENRVVATVDIGSAFLNANASERVPIHMLLDRQMSEIMCEIDQTYRDFLTAKGEILVKLGKALYGCLESALLWHKHLTATLAQIGYTQNKADPCVYNAVKEGVCCTIVLHVDDLFIASQSEALKEEILAHLKSTYKETSENRGVKHNYLGMVFDMSISGQVTVSMPGYEQALFNDLDKKYRPAATPAKDDLFEIDETSERLNSKDAAEFHTNVAKLLYLAKRVRPECMVAVNFLCQRVTKSTLQDQEKLNRLLGYIQSTPGASIMFMPGEKGITLALYVDASYGVHPDGKSQSGATLIVGDHGPVFIKSAKQTIVAKSSTEAELVATSDSANQLIYARLVLDGLGYPQSEPSVLYQDNMSTMALIKSGRPMNERSRHIGIRYFWITERVSNGEFRVAHMPTELMLANLLTKPLQGLQFRNENWLLSRSAHLGSSEP